MYKGSRSRVFPIIVVIVIVAIIVFALVSIVKFFTGNSPSDSNSKAASISSKLVNSDDSQSIIMDVRGPIVADEDFRSFEVSISPTSRSITAWKGYDRTDVVATEEYSNDTAAYIQFVHALGYAGYTKSNTVKIDNTKGLCADGKVYDFNIMSGSSVTDSRWTTNCGVKGTFGGNGPAVRQLFLNQIPDANKITSQINL